MGELALNGIRPADIDTVFITHLHADHCGSAALCDENKQLQIAFPNATYRWTTAEQTYWSGELPPQQIARRDIFAAVAPRWEAADAGASLAPGVDVYWMPGHTPGHAGVVVSSGIERAFILGDVKGESLSRTVVRPCDARRGQALLGNYVAAIIGAPDDAEPPSASVLELRVRAVTAN